MSITSIRAVTVNLADRNDYFIKHGREEASRQDPEHHRESYVEAERKTAELLASSGASVFFLQEVTRDFDSDPSGPAQERLLLKNLRERSFTIVRTGENKETSRSDTAIAIDSNAFSDIEDHSQEIQYVDVAIATAIDKKSGKKVLFISAHITGFGLIKKADQTLGKMGEAAAIGDKQAAAIMAQIQEQFQDCEIQIVGADMNSNQKLGEASPNRVGGLDTVVNPYTEIGKKRFDYFTDEGFDVVGSNKPTNLNERDAGYSMRELDFFLVRTMVKVNRFFKGFLSYFRVYREETKAEILPGANLFNTSYASDHLPVVMTYELKVEYKGIAKLFHNFLQLFRRNPPAEQTPVQMLATEEL